MQLTSEQIAFIENDLYQKGIRNEGLREDLLDHICCILETQEISENNFRKNYYSVLLTFYDDSLEEIENNLYHLTFNNNKIMNKTMILSGIFSTTAICLGIIFKLMHWPGAVAILPFGLLVAGIVFLPLLFILRSKNEDKTEKQLSALMATSLVLLCLCFAAKIIYGPQFFTIYMLLFVLSSLVTIAGYIPLYLKSGINKTISGGVAMVLVIAYALLFTVVLGSAKNRPDTGTGNAVTQHLRQ